MSRRKHAIRRDEGLHLTDRQREIPGTDWNRYVNGCARISPRHFARVHDIPFATWQREFRREAASPIVRHGNRWTYPEYDIDRARDSINKGRGNMGAPMKLTVGMAILFRHAVLKLGRSPHDARMMIVESMPDRRVPCWKKGRVENSNRLVRRWYPKGTDFSGVTVRRTRVLEGWINPVHRMSTGGSTAYKYHSHLADSA